jgi:hypothetical protein
MIVTATRVGTTTTAATTAAVVVTFVVIFAERHRCVWSDSECLCADFVLKIGANACPSARPPGKSCVSTFFEHES